MTNVEASSVKRVTVRGKDPACGTCRKKCRKCDRKRPICNRCRSKGLHCEGYPPRFQFTETLTASPAGRQRSESVNASQSSDPASRARSVPLSTNVAEASPESIIQASAPETSTTTTLSIEHTLPDSTIISVSSPLSSPATTQFSPINYASPPVAASELESEIQANQHIIEYFDRTLSKHLIIHVQGIENPFNKFVLPLAYQHQAILHALLGLSACHMHISGHENTQHYIAASLHYRLSALRSLGALLPKEEVSGLEPPEEECILAIVLLLVLHDICETGVSSHGAHLTGVSFLCKRMTRPNDFSKRSKASMFFISALTWLDMLRGFSGAEKLSYSADVRQCVHDHGSLSLHTLVGCPPGIFHKIGRVLEAGKAYLAGDLPLEQFQQLLDESEQFFRSWDPEQAVYPTMHQEWKHLAEAYRHACLLRVMRFPDSFAISCEDPRIKASVSAILDVCAVMPRDSVFYKRLLFPAFLAGADTLSAHQMHYASWCINEIKHATGFQHPAMTEVLTKVWDERRTNPHGWANVPWMEFTCSELLSSQHAYLFF